MESILQRIANECAAGKFTLASGAAKEAFDALIAQQGNSAYEMHQLREKCLAAIELALDTKSARIVRLSTDALQFILRDNQLHSLPDSKENVEETLPMQVVHTLHDLPAWSHDSDLQCHCFTILLQVTSSSSWSVDSHVICKIVQLCISTFTASNQLSTRMAARATVIQTVNSFCSSIYNRVDNETPANQDEYRKMFQEITKLLNYCCTKLKAIISSPQESPPLLLMLDAIHAILNAQDENICNYEEFLQLLWQEFTPIVINILGDPSQMELASSISSASDAIRGRGVGAVGGDQVIFGAPEVAKSAYRICGELLRLLGRLTPMRSVLEALFHRFLLFPPPEKRLEALKVLKSILENPRRIVDLGFNLCQPVTESSTTRSDLTLWQIVLDCLVDCTMQSNADISTMAVRCTAAFVSSLTEICDDNADYFTENNVSVINKRFVKLSDADFDGVDYSSIREKFSFETDSTSVTNIPHKTDDDSNLTHDEIETNNAEEVSKAEGNLDDSMKSVAGRIGASLRNTSDSIEDSVVAYLDRIRSAWDQNLKLKPHAPLQKCSSFEKRELDAASDFVDELSERLAEWNSAKSTIELDVALQTFAAETCEKFMMKQLGLLQKHGSMYEAAIYNADALYLVTYASLDLCYSLFTSKTQEIFETNVIVSNSKFVENVTITGSISYVSLSFIDAVYRLLSERDVLTNTKIIKPSAVFCDLIKDYHGRNGDVLSDFLRLERTAKRRNVDARHVAAVKFTRRLTTISWSAIVEILSVLIDRANASSLLPTLSLCAAGRLATKNSRVAEGIVASLEGLQRLLVLCPQVELKNKCGWIFRKLAEASCPLEELRRVVQKEQEKSNGFSLKLSLGRSSGWEIQTPHALSIQLILDNAIQVGSGDATCWNPVIRCIEYVCEFEHRYFSSTSTSRKFFSSFDKNSSSKSKESLSKFDVDEDDFVISMPLSPVRNSENILDAIELIDGHQNVGYLSEKATAKVLCIFSAKIERFYEDCCRCLNMDALKELIKCLVCASQSNLFYGASLSRGRLPPWSLLERLGTILNRIARSGRPLVHLMTIWGIAAPHFIEAACASNPEFTCRTVDFLRESISALLESGANLPSFHFNESLFQPFQTILCLELCGEETFDRIVCAIAELVECYKKEIHTGWKSLFGALKAVRCSYMFSKQEMSDEDLTHLLTAVVDVFSCFLKSDNLKVFCRASGECIACLLRFLVDDENDAEPLTNRNLDDDELASNVVAPTPDFAKTALCFLRQCHTLLVSLYSGPTDDVVVHLIRRLTPKDHSRQIVDRDLPHLSDSHSLPSLASFLGDQQNLFGWNLSPFFLEQRLEEPSLSVPWATFPVGKQLVCEAWVDLIEGLVGSIATCPRYLQPEVIDSVYGIVGGMLDLPGLTFAAYCMNHLVLPMLQRWLRRESLNDAGWRENVPSVRNFKQCLGLTVDTVVKYLESDPDASCNRLLLSQTFDLLTECISMPSEVVARLGCSSFRHIINSLKDRLTTKLWDVVCRCMWRIGSVTLHSLRLLMSYFAVGSRRYAGDMGTVQVAMRKDSNPAEAARFRVLAQQVFLVDTQKYEENLEDHPDKLSQSYRSIVFLLNPSDTSANVNVIRLPFRNIVFGLLSHQLWLQLIGTILADGTNIKLTALSSTLTRHVYSSDASSSSLEKLSGCLEFLTNEQVCSLLLCLDASFVTAYEFDRRPGLKFLLQKVFSSPVSSNLYKQAVTCWTFKALTLYQLATLAVFESPKLTVKQIKEISDDECIIDCGELAMEKLAKDFGVFYLRLMCRSYLNVCQAFCDIESALIGGESHADRLASHALDIVLPIDSADFREDDSQKSSENESRASFTPSSSRSGSTRGSPAKSTKRPFADSSNHAPVVEDGETIYSLASTDVVQAFLKDYKRHKQRNTLVVRSKNETPRKNPFDENSLSSTAKIFNGAIDKLQSTTPTTMNNDTNEFCDDPNVHREVIDSLMKDGEAACLAWSEMGASLLQSVLTLPNDQFRSMLPSVFQAATLMTSRTSNRRIKLISTDLLYRLVEVYQIFE